MDGLTKKHDGFTTTLEAQREKITTLEQLCQALLAQDHYASDQIRSRCDGVVDRMGRVVEMTESRRLKLLDSRSYQQFLCNTYEVSSNCFCLPVSTVYLASYECSYFALLLTFLPCFKCIFNIHEILQRRRSIS